MPSHQGLGRSYVKVDGDLTYADGRAGSAVIRLGEGGSELSIVRPSTVRLNARIAARLNPQSDEQIRRTKRTEKPFWHLERARIGDSQDVPIEVIVNGQSVARKTITANGQLQDVSFEIGIERSSWVALRILPSLHTNPIWVRVADKPVRASQRSIEWCLLGVDRCWSQKQRFIAPAELAQARSDYDHARRVYRQRLAEADVP